MNPPMTDSSPQPRLALFWKLFAFAVVILIGHILAQIAATLLKVATRVSPTIWQPVLQAVVVLLISKLFLRAFERQSLRAIGIGFDRPWIRQTLIGLAIGAVLVALAWGLLVTAGQARWEFNADFHRHIPQFLFAVPFAIGIGMYEEILCRGYALQVLYRWNRLVGIAVPGLYFVAVHLPQTGGTAPLAILNMLLAHLLYVVCFLRTRSLWLGIGIHVAWNFFLAFIFGMPISGLKTPATVMRTDLPQSLFAGNEFGPEAGLVVTVVLAVATLLLWLLVPGRRPAPNLIDEDTPIAEAPIEVRAIQQPGLPLAPAVGPQTNRFPALDVLRAIAVFGILPMNIQGFALHDSAVLNPYACAWTDPLNVGVWVITTALFGRKDLMLFAMMFGAGILMIADRCAGAGRSALPIHFQRMAALMLIALIHAYLIWPGDILFTYSVCGMAVFACRNWSPKRLLCAGSGLFLVPIVLLIVAQLCLPLFGESLRAEVLGSFLPTAETIAAHYEIYRGSWLAQMPTRASGAFTQHTVLLLMAMGWVSAGMMLVGMALYRMGYLTGQRGRAGYGRLLAWSALIGTLLTVLGFWLNFQNGWRAEFSMFIGRFPGELGAPLLALSTIALVMLFFAHRERNWLTTSLAAVGQMSLTNYLMHSVILTFLFYGTGLGWIGTVDRVQQLLIVVAIWLLQMIYSPLWLSYFHFGPVEWLWRTLAYVRWQPMRRKSAIVGAAAH